MRSAVASFHGALSDKELPSKSLLARKLEQAEDNSPHVEDLRDVTSVEDAEAESYAAVIDPSSASCLCFKPGCTLTTPPCTPEELRLRRRHIGLAWHMVRTKHATRSWLLESVVDSFRLSDHVLGDRVAGLRAEDGRAPKWSLVLK